MGVGDGYGVGVGYGAGDGFGCGYGCGVGYSYDKFFEQFLESTIPKETYLKFKKIGAKIAIWKTNKDATPSNGGSGGVRKAGDVEEVEGPLEICTERALHATLEPQIWKGERMFAVALYPPVVGNGEKYASLKREIIMELPWCI